MNNQRTGLGWTTLLPITIIGCLCTFLSGCGGGDQGFTGSVTYLGQPVDEGVIQFYVPGKDPRPVAGAPIKNGSYAVPPGQGLTPGRYLVRITSRQWDKAGQEATKNPFLSKERIPEKFNERSELTIELKPRETRTFDFRLD
jgi:hypothetical protein